MTNESRKDVIMMITVSMNNPKANAYFTAALAIPGEQGLYFIMGKQKIKDDELTSTKLHQ